MDATGDTDTWWMRGPRVQHGIRTDRGEHFSCSMSAVLLARVNAFAGPDAVAEVLRLAGTHRTPEYLLDITNWIAYDEAVALWQAGAQVTHHPNFARAVGEDAARRLAGSQVAAMLRSLGSPENVYGAIATSSGEFSTVTKLEVRKAAHGLAEVVATAADGFPRSPEHCAWTCGLLASTTVLFGLELGASIGRAVFPIDADDPDGLLQAADAAMFGVKRRGRGRTLSVARGADSRFLFSHAVNREK